MRLATTSPRTSVASCSGRRPPACADGTDGTPQARTAQIKKGPAIAGPSCCGVACQPAAFFSAGADAALAASAFQPQVLPSFCCFSHACSGEKYSSTAEASIFSLPVSSFSVCCHGWLAPLLSIAWYFAPAALLP